LDFCPPTAPIEIEIRNLNHTLRVTDIDERRLDRSVRYLKRSAIALRESRLAHVHFEHERHSAAFQKAQGLDAGPRANADRAGGQSDVDQEGGRAARAVAGDFGYTAVRVEKLNRAVEFLFARRRLGDQQPAVCPDTRVPFADGNRRLSQLLARRLVAPGQQEVVAGAVRFGERNSHFSSAARPRWLSRL